MSVVDIAVAEASLASLHARDRTAWALEHLPGAHVLSSSFGAQAAVSLPLAVSLRPARPRGVVDSGYLFPETYRFIDTLRERLSLNLHVTRAAIGPAWHEARDGRLWEQGGDGLATYNRVRKVEPMRHALDELGAGTWIAGLRRDQSRGRAATPFIQRHEGRWKVHPIADWSDRDVGRYLVAHGLPYHPLWDEGYVSIGDTPTTRRFEPGMHPDATRLFGGTRARGLHAAL